MDLNRSEFTNGTPLIGRAVFLLQMRIEEFDFHLPDEQIAQTPLAERAASRMMLVDRAAGEFRDSQFASFPTNLREGDVVVLNNTKVFPARLNGRTETGAAVEIFLIDERADGTWEVLAKPGRRLREGKRIELAEDLAAEVVAKNEDGKVIVRFDAKGDLSVIVDRIGSTPLPPYIKREGDAAEADRERYQTIYASNRGAIAAPTAGLHFTPEVIDQVEAQGASLAELTLHVGYGTFEPVRSEDLTAHKVLPERYLIGPETAEMLNAAKAGGRRIVAIGTTSTRALESNLQSFDTFRSGSYLAEVTITPGYRFRAVDALLTNFHLPKSSLLVLTSVFGGHELIMDSYRHAVAEGYRFYSYGDCMFIS